MDGKQEILDIVEKVYHETATYNKQLLIRRCCKLPFLHARSVAFTVSI
jgi:hypothetical protein